MSYCKIELKYNEWRSKNESGDRQTDLFLEQKLGTILKESETKQF